MILLYMYGVQCSGFFWQFIDFLKEIKAINILKKFGTGFWWWKADKEGNLCKSEDVAADLILYSLSWSTQALSRLSLSLSTSSSSSSHDKMTFLLFLEEIYAFCYGLKSIYQQHIDRVVVEKQKEEKQQQIPTGSEIKVLKCAIDIEMKSLVAFFMYCVSIESSMNEFSHLNNEKSSQ